MSRRADLIQKIQPYLLERRRGGVMLSGYERTLENFVGFAARTGHRGPLTLKLACRWAMASQKKRRSTAARRMSVVRGFARYCQSLDPATEVPPVRLFGPCSQRRTPHIYTAAEIRALMQAAQALPPSGGLRGLTCATIFGLLASCGLRISEAIGLTREDVQFEAARLHLRDSKFGKSRWAILHPTTRTALHRYAQRRDQDPLSAGHDAFFMFDDGHVPTVEQIGRVFARLRKALGWRSRGDHRYPRLHDLRHTFVCRRLQRWYDEGADVDQRMQALATYVGHLNPSCTYWYITATPELMPRAAHRLAPPRLGGGS